MKKFIFFSIIFTSLFASALELNFVTQALSVPLVHTMLNGYQVTAIKPIRLVRSFNGALQKTGAVVVCAVRASGGLVHTAVMIPNGYAYGYETTREILQYTGATKHRLCE
ncbi:MAG: hypothetical protein AB7O96_20090 [Pseudobdellovibrionaceae bacterium]